MRLLLLGLGVFILSGCCKPNKVVPNDGFMTMTRYPVLTFVDSLEQELSFVYSSSSFDTLDYPSAPTCNGIEVLLFPKCEFTSNWGQISYHQAWPGIDIDDYVRGLYAINGDGYYIPPLTMYPGIVPEVDTIIRGQLFEECFLTRSLDSTRSALFSPDYGIIAFTYYNERWERVLD